MPTSSSSDDLPPPKQGRQPAASISSSGSEDAPAARKPAPKKDSASSSEDEPKAAAKKPAKASSSGSADSAPAGKAPGRKPQDSSSDDEKGPAAKRPQDGSSSGEDAPSAAKRQDASSGEDDGSSAGSGTSGRKRDSVPHGSSSGRPGGSSSEDVSSQARAPARGKRGSQDSSASRGGSDEEASSSQRRSSVGRSRKDSARSDLSGSRLDEGDEEDEEGSGESGEEEPEEEEEEEVGEEEEELGDDDLGQDPGATRPSSAAGGRGGGKAHGRGAPGSADRVPAPPGTTGPMGHVSMKDLRSAFTMLDVHKAGVLTRGQARSWLRCAGWALGDVELDAMLDTRRGFGATRRTAWKFPELLEVLESCKERANLSVEGLQQAFRTLAQKSDSISRSRLAELLGKQNQSFGEADLDEVLALVGLAGEEVLDCDDVGTRILDTIRFPPSTLAQHELVRPKPAAAVASPMVKDTLRFWRPTLAKGFT